MTLTPKYFSMYLLRQGQSYREPQYNYQIKKFNSDLPNIQLIFKFP